ncbi:MAG TPA: hypothetical protein VMI75_10960 [Polyangiaceae bacterium]|nr:hypothetical protein [Polyangiaceae bacterium]
MRTLAVVALIGLAGCESSPIPPPPRLPPTPGPLPASQYPEQQDDDDAPAADDPRLPPRPRPTGDREADALSLGFWGCRVMGLRLVPDMSGRAWIRATLGAAGEVVDVVAVRVESLPRPVVQCLMDRVARARFDPRGGQGSEIHIPVDFTGGNSRGPTRTLGTVPTQSL